MSHYLPPPPPPTEETPEMNNTPTDLAAGAGLAQTIHVDRAALRRLVLGDVLPDLLAQAWDEGFTAGVNADMGDYEHPDDGSWHTNPYRQETTA